MSEAVSDVVETQQESDKMRAESKGPRGKVIIFEMWCKGCRICVEFCPTGVLAFKDDRPVVVKPEACTACHWCDTHCPDLAITVKRIVK